jgi:hypothetical protein
MDRSHIKRFNRRARMLKWAQECLQRATEQGSLYRARRATYLTQALSIWLDKNAPVIIEAYYER